ncbi:MAG TPA: hypothetical protein VHO06_15465, partial [Polyangia bacterium]|nr:hypothetical protein [Polyangia bacterium]
PAPVLSPLFSPAPETAPLIAVREPVPVAPSRSVAHPPSRRAKAHRHRRHPVAQRAAARR